MSDFQLEDKGNAGNQNRLQQNVSEKGMLGFLLKKGIAKSENAANYILIGIAVFFFLMSVLAFKVL